MLHDAYRINIDVSVADLYDVLTEGDIDERLAEQMLPHDRFNSIRDDIKQCLKTVDRCVQLQTWS